MPFATELLLLVLGGIVTYIIKAVTDKSKEADIKDSINSIRDDISGIKEMLIRGEAVEKHVGTLQEQVEELYESRNELRERIIRLEEKAK
jgi:peptidoglycan hydrolase CwlO-like protein